MRSGSRSCIQPLRRNGRWRFASCRSACTPVHPSECLETVSQDVLSLDPEERAKPTEQAWEMLADRPDSVLVPCWQRAEIESRPTGHEADPEATIPREAAHDRIKVSGIAVAGSCCCR
mgnify:CR=1 FL=1